MVFILFRWRKMKKLPTTFMIATFCFAIFSEPSVPSAASQVRVSKAGNTDCAALKLHALSRYKDERWARVFSDREVAPVLRTLLKSHSGLLRESLKEVSYPEDSLTYLDKNGVLTFEGGVPGLYTIMEAKLIIEPCGNIYVALLDEGKQFLYFTNDQKNLDKLPPAIEQWRLKIESLRSQTNEVPKLPIVFKSK
jgi:hypothetical protein